MAWTRRSFLGGFAATVTSLPTGFARSEPDAGKPLVLEAAPGSLQLLPPPAPATQIWSFNSQVPGPLIRLTLGEEVNVRLVNRLAEPTSLSWHGVRNVNAMDGVAGLTQPPVQPGGTFSYRFTPADAGTYWYHPHIHPRTSAQVRRGLYGLLLVDEPKPPVVDQDLLVVIADWSVDAKGQISEDASTGTHRGVAGERLGDLVTMNSKPIPTAPIDVRPGSRLRLRLINVCAARIAVVALTGIEALVIAIDGQPSDAFPPANNAAPVGPGARFDIVVDLPNRVGATAALTLRGEADGSHPLISFRVAGAPVPERPRIERLQINSRLPARIPLEASLRHSLVLGEDTNGRPWRWTINGRGSDGFSEPPIFKARRGEAVTLTLVNKTGQVQQIHIHGHVFRILHDLDDGWDPYWRESILLAPGRTKRVAFVADNPGRWAIGSSILDRQVTGMTGWFYVA